MNQFHVIAITTGVLFFAQLVGIFLRSIEDGHTFSRSLKVVLAMLFVYGAFLLIPFIVLYQLWISKSWEEAQSLSLREKIRTSLLSLFTAHYFYMKHSLKRAREHMYDGRKKMTFVAEQPIRDRLLDAV